MSYNPLARQVSFVAALIAQGQWKYNAKEDPVPDPAADPESGRPAVEFDVSVGSGRGSSKMILKGDQTGDLVTAVDEWDPTAEETEDETPEDIATAFRSTRQVETEGEGDDEKRFIVFKLSLRKNARTFRVPFDEWNDFKSFLKDVHKGMPDVAKYWRQETARLNAEAAEKAAKAAKAGEPAEAPKRRGRPPKAKAEDSAENPAAK